MKKVCVIFGGMSSEHDVSCVSGATVADSLKKDRYEVILVGITKDGHWLKVDSVDSIRDGSWRKSSDSAVISPDTKGEIIIDSDGNVTREKIDVVVPVLHGLFGEDGTIQGLLTMSGIPYTGCGHLSSAITMDKFFTKVIADSINVTQAAYVPVRDYELSDMDSVVARVEAERKYPVFIKPSNAGSSMGVSKARNREELIAGLKEAARHDSKILVEEAINGREVECAVFGTTREPKAYGVGEIVAAAEFYDFDAKYNNAESKTIIEPELPAGKREEIMDIAVAIYRACDCYGFARVDFFLERETDRVVFNEINTIPGHTAISMFPMIMGAAGKPLSDYLDELIDMAESR